MHNSTLQVGLQITLGHPLDTEIAVRSNPAAAGKIVFEDSAVCRAVIKFANEAEMYPGTEITGDAKSHGVTCPLPGQSPTVRCVAQIAQLAQFFVSGLDMFVSRRATIAGPTAAQGQSGRVQPAIFKFPGGQKEWAGHSVASFPGCGNSTQDGDGPPVLVVSRFNHEGHKGTSSESWSHDFVPFVSLMLVKIGHYPSVLSAYLEQAGESF